MGLKIGTGTVLTHIVCHCESWVYEYSLSHAHRATLSPYVSSVEVSVLFPFVFTLVQNLTQFSELCEILKSLRKIINLLERKMANGLAETVCFHDYVSDNFLECSRIS